MIGRVWTSAIGLLLIPIYIRMLGMEAWGLLGIFIAIQNVLPILDLGLSATLNRELAQLSAQENSGQKTVNLVRTLETIYWCMSGFIALTLLSGSYFLAHRWVHGQHLQPALIQQAVMIMAFRIALQFPFSLYQGGLMGLQQQVALNRLTVIIANIAGFGTIAALRFIAPTIQVYVTCQMLAALAQTALAARLLWRCLPASSVRPAFNLPMLHSLRTFALGVSGSALLAAILMELPAIVLSKILPLADMGYFTLAWNVSNILSLFTLAIFNTFYPAFSRLVAADNKPELQSMYHRACQLMACVVLPVALMLILFPRELILLWTNDPVKAQHTYAVIRLLAAAQALSALFSLPFALQLAHGWTKLNFSISLASVFFFVPLLLLLTTRYGAVGASSLSIALYSVYLLVGLPWMHSRLLPHELTRWLRNDFALPLSGVLAIGALVTAFSAHLFVTTLARLTLAARCGLALELGIITCIAVLAAMLCAPQMRALLFSFIARTNRAALDYSGLSL